jgi:hypothetical protein
VARQAGEVRRLLWRIDTSFGSSLGRMEFQNVPICKEYFHVLALDFCMGIFTRLMFLKKFCDVGSARNVNVVTHVLYSWFNL